MRSRLIVTALALALAGCNRPDLDRQQRADADHPKQDYTSSLLSRMSASEIDAVTVPPAPAERGPIPPNANFADPATNASLAFPEGSARASIVPPPGSDHSPEGEHLQVMAQDAAARAPDTAAADAAIRKVYEDAARGATSTEKVSKAPADSSSEEPRAQESSSPSPSKSEST